MEAKKRKNKSWLIILTGFFILLLGVGTITYYFVSNKQLDNLEEDALKTFYIEEEQINNEVEHPKINLERGLVDPSSYLNNVNYNIQFLKNSAMPDQRYGNVMLAAHSGNARVSYFKNLNKLEMDDNVSISYKGKIYNYKVVNIYDIEKTGKAQIIRNKNVSTLTLVTCRHNTNKQIIVICELVDIK